MGRKLKQDNAQERLLEAIRKGLTIEDACDYAGIVKQTYYNWLNKDVETTKDEVAKKKFCGLFGRSKKGSVRMSNVLFRLPNER